MAIEIPRVATAAILIDGVIHTLPRPGRHHDIIRHLVRKGFKKPVVGEQGFVLTDGRFVVRELAAKIALAAGQCKELRSPPRLFSEDLW